MDPNQQPQDQATTQPNEQPQPVIPTPEQLNPTQATPTPQSESAPQPQVVYMSRPLEPERVEVSPEVQAKHEASKKKYPSLNLSEGEYVISAVKRHPIGMLPIFGIVAIILVGLGVGIPLYDSLRSSSPGLPPTAIVSVLAILLGVLVIIGGYIAVYVYVNNKFFLTNESVIQEIQHSLFAKHEQTVSLSNIEDASFYQNGIFPYIFNYGLVRLSTEGDETTYRFSYVANPKKEIAILNNAVEAFKNGRPFQND